MSEARRRKRAFDDLLKKYPWCIYCGGVVQADTVGHNPARIIFLGKQRPKGLEFPSCEACNRGTSHADLVAGLMSRVYPDAPTDAARDELKKILNAVANNIPGLLQEMEVRREEEKNTSKGRSWSAAFRSAIAREWASRLEKHDDVRSKVRFCSSLRSVW
jgi:hypothetical protein